MSKVIIIGTILFISIVTIGINAKEIHDTNIQKCLDNSDYSRETCTYILR